MTCLESFVGYPEISQWLLDFITRFHAHVLMNAFTFAFAYDMFGIFCEICRNQSMVPRFPLDFITRIHVHEGDLLVRGIDKDRDRQTDTDRQSDTDRQTERDRESQTGRHTEIKTQRETTRKTDRQTEALLYVSAFLALSVPC